jgi:hypothetical protein
MRPSPPALFFSLIFGVLRHLPSSRVVALRRIVLG